MKSVQFPEEGDILSILFHNPKNKDTVHHPVGTFKELGSSVKRWKIAFENIQIMRIYKFLYYTDNTPDSQLEDSVK